MPKHAELSAACELIAKHLMAFKGMHHGVASGRQLTVRLEQLRADPRLPTLVEQEVSNDFARNIDEAVESVIQFQRSWAQFEFPRHLRALERIARDVLGRAGVEVGSFGAFASASERLFLPANVQVLDEYGIPPQVAHRLFPQGAADLDEMLAVLRSLDVRKVAQNRLETDVLVDAQRRLELATLETLAAAGARG